MPPNTGTYTIADLAENTFAATTVQEFGMDNLTEAIQADLDTHNARVDQMLAEMAEISTERSTVYGTNAQGDMVSADELTRGPTQKVTIGSKVEFPLDKFQFATGWTADFLRRAKVQDMAKRTISARQAHLRRIQKSIKEALFGSTNFTWVDRIVDSNSLAVKRLVNADSGTIPNGPNGETYAGASHTHYDAIDWAAATGAQKAAALSALITDVVEHGHGDDVRVYINLAQEADVRALTGFTALATPNVAYRNTDTGVQVLDITRADNRLIGFFNGYPVWTKPWVPANYFFAFSAGDARKTLRFRKSMVPTESGLFIAGEIITHPLQSQYMEAFFGVGVLTRTNGAVLYLSAGTYADPTFT